MEERATERETITDSWWKLKVGLQGSDLKCAGSLAWGACSLVTRMRKMLRKKQKLARMHIRPISEIKEGVTEEENG